MGQIYVKFDNKFNQSDIIVPIYDTPQDMHKQTEVYGIIYPLIELNNVFIAFNDMISFELKSTGTLPTVSFTAHDRKGLTATLDTISPDNEIRIQILPKFENAYKKINLTFLVSRLQIQNGIIDARGTLKCPKFTSSKFQSFGEINTYDLFEKVARDSDFGFATNCESNDDDKRYVYCNHISYNDLLGDEINLAKSDATHIYDWWVDFWNNINYVNIYERYNTIDPEEDLQIWTSGHCSQGTKDTEIIPEKVTALIHNHPIYSNNDLYTEKYEIINKLGANTTAGTDKVYSVYEEDNKEYKDHLVMDGDVKKDIYENFEYLGEVYGSYNYLLANKCKEAYSQKMGTESIKVILKQANLALMRGFKVNFVWYVNNDNWENTMEDYKTENIMNDNVKTSIPLDDSLPPEIESGINETSGKFIIDKAISGQYMITGCDMIYKNSNWSYELTLTRPISQKPQLLNKFE